MQVLFLGGGYPNSAHNGRVNHHKLIPDFLRSGIELTFSDDWKDRNPTTLGRYEGVVMYHETAEGRPEWIDANYHRFAKEDTQAWAHGVQKLQPFYGPTRGFSFAKDVQPILDRNCVQCHDGSNEHMDLRGIPTDKTTTNKRRWTRSYLNLTAANLDRQNSFGVDQPETGLVSWISMMSRPTELPPYFAGSAKSPLVTMQEEGHHEVQLSR